MTDPELVANLQGCVRSLQHKLRDVNTKLENARVALLAIGADIHMLNDICTGALLLGEEAPPQKAEVPETPGA